MFNYSKEFSHRNKENCISVGKNRNKMSICLPNSIFFPIETRKMGILWENFTNKGVVIFIFQRKFSIEITKPAFLWKKSAANQLAQSFFFCYSKTMLQKKES